LSEELQTVMNLIVSLLFKYPQFWRDLDKVIVAPEVSEEEAGIKFLFVRRVSSEEGAERARRALVKMVEGIARSFEPTLPVKDGVIEVCLTEEEKEALKEVFR